MGGDSKAHQWEEDQTILQNPGIVLAAREQPSQKLTVASIHYDFEASVVLPDFHAQKSWATLQHSVRLMAKSWDLKKPKQFWILSFSFMFKASHFQAFVWEYEH